MRSIETLVREYPNKTGEEILAIQEEDKRKDQVAYDKANQDKLKLIEDYNTNGAYFRGKFGMNQHYYFSLSNLWLEEDGNVRCSSERITCFIQVDLSINIRQEDYQKVEQILGPHQERITKKDYIKFREYLTDIENLFW